MTWEQRLIALSREKRHLLAVRILHWRMVLAFWKRLCLLSKKGRRKAGQGCDEEIYHDLAKLLEEMSALAPLYQSRKPAACHHGEGKDKDYHDQLESLISELEQIDTRSYTFFWCHADFAAWGRWGSFDCDGILLRRSKAPRWKKASNGFILVLAWAY